VFLLYAEDEGLMPNDDIYTRNYSVTGLYEKLLEDSGNYPDTMDQRYGGYAWLLSLFRLVYDGGGHLPHYLPARQGQLFDPHTYPFLEGRSLNCAQTQQPEDLKDISLLGFSPDHQRAKAQQPEDLKDISLLGFSPDHQRAKAQQQGQPMIPRVSDGVIFRVLNSLLILDGERLSYRSLDVEQIGSVYEAVMGYEVECAEGLSAGIWTKPAGAKVSVTVVINVEELLATKAKDRSTFLKDYSCELAGKSLTALQQAKTPDEVLSALGRKLSPQTPTLLPVGSLYLQPTEERRRTASHYTPRSMTEPIVKETLRPILKLLGDRPTPEQLLNLKICDLAMGSGAFLVETCRQLAEELVKAWEREETPLLRFSAEDKMGLKPNNEPNNNLNNRPINTEDPLLLARRLIAQRCLYGVDKNQFAVNLAKLSLWLVTLAKDQPFTFLDHALKCGDSLVGLMKSQIGAFTWTPQKQGAALGTLFEYGLKQGLDVAKSNRDQIYTLSDQDYQLKQQLNQAAETALAETRFSGDLIIGSFFSADKQKAREDKRDELRLQWQEYRKTAKNIQAETDSNVAENKSNNLDENPIIQSFNLTNTLQAVSLRECHRIAKPINPFHWEIEFPEVFERENGGFDAIVGNPPFMGKNTAINAHAEGYMDWIKEIHPESHGNSDIVAHFFRRAFDLLRKDGCFGLIATNTIAQGDTRTTGLRWICHHHGIIYNATKRKKWEGLAAVVVSIVHVYKS
jgi:hypothetical protein